MLFFAAVAAIAVAANGQHLRIAPAVIGTTAVGSEQVIPLGGGPAHHGHPVVHHQKYVAAVKPVHVAAPVTTFSVAEPIHHKYVTVAKPVVHHVPTTFSVAQPIHHKIAYVAQPTAYVAKPFETAHHVVKPIVSQPLVAKVQTFDATPIVKVAHHHQPSHLNVQEEKYEILPYSFAFDSEDEHQNKHGRQEAKDANGVITGQYTVAGADGISRIVSYVADHDGFRASIKTNEPGTLTSAPAGAHIESTATVPARR